MRDSSLLQANMTDHYGISNTGKNARQEDFDRLDLKHIKHVD